MVETLPNEYDISRYKWQFEVVPTGVSLREHSSQAHLRITQSYPRVCYFSFVALLLLRIVSNAENEIFQYVFSGSVKEKLISRDIAYNHRH